MLRLKNITERYTFNGNLTKEERIYDNLQRERGISIALVLITIKKPLFNIAGFKELLNQNDKISINNVISTVITSTTINGQITSATTYKNAFTYDLENYPKERVSESTPLASGFGWYLKVEYFIKVKFSKPFKV
jgi:hypothetical protein